MRKKAAEMSVFEMTMAGLEDSITYSGGDRESLVTMEHSALHERNERRINMNEQDGQDELKD